MFNDSSDDAQVDSYEAWFSRRNQEVLVTIKSFIQNYPQYVRLDTILD